MPKNLYESEKLFLALKMPYDKIHVCPKGCVLFRKEHADAKYCPKCKSSRYVEVDSGDGQKRQLKIPMRVLRHLSFLPRIQRLFMTEESVKQMTCRCIRIERILLAMVRGYVLEHVWLVLEKLSYFFRRLCAKELSKSIIEELKKMVPELVCELEKIFPPDFFLSMQHLIVHLPNEAKLRGHIQARWCYLIKRCLKTLRKKCTNKARIEASIVEASIREEVSNFTTSYYKLSLPSNYNPPPRYNADEVESTLSLFKGQLGSTSGSTPKRLDPKEWRRITLYVFTNLVEVQPFIK
jgi:hypothetical protein